MMPKSNTNFQFLLVRLRASSSVLILQLLTSFFQFLLVRLRARDSSDPESDTLLSIPSGAIKRASLPHHLRRSLSLSIPSGAIKRLSKEVQVVRLMCFQFLLVRLRASINEISAVSTVFQFLLVRLRVNIDI